MPDDSKGDLVHFFKNNCIIVFTRCLLIEYFAVDGMAT